MTPEVKSEIISNGPDLSILGLFFQSDPIVKGIMILLILASIWCWTIIFNKSSKIKKEIKLSAQFEDAFWSGVDLDDLYNEILNNVNNAQKKVFIAGMKEFEKNKSYSSLSYNKIVSFSQRLNSVMQITIGREMDRLEKGMSFLASIGSVAPFIGLLGTVWGIVNAFQSIAQSNNTSLAVVAPGIAEALFATALGILAAIPAVAAYNKFSNDLTKYASNLEYFAAELSAILVRQIDEN